MAAVGVEVRVEHGDLRAEGAGREGFKECDELLGVQATGVGAVDRRHVLRVENIDVQLQPVTPAGGVAGHAACRGGGDSGADRAHPV